MPTPNSSISAAFREDLIDACVMESTFREHMAERDLLFHDTVALHLAAYALEASAAQQRDFLNHLHQTLNAPSHPIRNRLLRLTASPPTAPTSLASSKRNHDSHSQQTHEHLHHHPCA